MRKRRAEREIRRAREFETFVAGAGGRLLHAAALLTGEPPERCPAAEDLLARALAGTYAAWDRLRGEDPYDRARQELAARYAHTAWRYRPERPRRPGPTVTSGAVGGLAARLRTALARPVREGSADTAPGTPDTSPGGGPAARPGARPRAAGGGLLEPLAPQERLVLVLRLYEGIAEEQAAATLGLPVDRVRAICTRAVFRLVDATRYGAPAARGPRPPARPPSGHRPGRPATPAPRTTAETTARRAPTTGGPPPRPPRPSGPGTAACDPPPPRPGPSGATREAAP
ncbi:sigma factor-like helix-turn-helix DNA-binding protein [Streptomyces sp. NPDC018031]|uniref:sigma factor-like helix-turn-helix DNA-binding protein n=1 Tax=Streptomyces sp. NPDC018031 TaxID=3365033 RepID=UPI0037A0470E